MGSSVDGWKREKGRVVIVTRGLPSQVDRLGLPHYVALHYVPTTTMRKRIASRIFCASVDGLTAHVCREGRREGRAIDLSTYRYVVMGRGREGAKAATPSPLSPSNTQQSDFNSRAATTFHGQQCRLIVISLGRRHGFKWDCIVLWSECIHQIICDLCLINHTQLSY